MGRQAFMGYCAAFQAPTTEEMALFDPPLIAIPDSARTV